MFGAAYSQEFNIEVTINYLNFQILNVSGENYNQWNMDTIPFDTTIYMDDSLGLHIMNLSNGPLSIEALVIDDTVGLGVPEDYSSWAPAFGSPYANFFVLEGVFTDIPEFPADTSGAVTFQSSLTNIYDSVPISEDKYLYLIFMPPAAPLDLYTHRLKIYFEGRINLY